MQDDFQSRIFAEHVSIGAGVSIAEGASFGTPDAPLRSVVIGDNVTIGEHCKFRVPDVAIGDYTQVHGYALANGYSRLEIGRNCWFGQNVILNATDLMQIGDNCGVGAYSQLWTHILYGDVLQGCRWDSTKPMILGDDVWLVGHCLVSPITAGDRSMALLGSVVSKDMAADRVYAGSPAKDLTDRVGPQFAPRSVTERVEHMQALKRDFVALGKAGAEAIGIAADGEVVEAGATMFDVVRRTYTKTRSPAEIAFMRYLLPRAKFVPQDS